MTRVPEHMIPDGPAVLGEPELVGGGPPLVEWFDGEAGTCPDCGGQLVRWDGDDGRQIACLDEPETVDALAPKTIASYPCDHERPR